MNQEKAVKGLMIDFRSINPYLHTAVYPEVERVLRLMWQVGWEHKGKELSESRWKKRSYVIQQFLNDSKGLILIGEYATPKDAVRYGGISRTSLWDALKLGRPTIKNHIWKRKYIDK